MNTLIGLLAVSVFAACPVARAQDPDPSQSPRDAAFASPIVTPAEQVATLTERMKFGYESAGYGVRLPADIHEVGEQTLRCLAGTGDSGAAKALWFRLTTEEKKLSRMPEAEEIALEQYRLIGHTILINYTAERYLHMAQDECTNAVPSEAECLVRNENFRKAAAWSKLGEKLGDPVSGSGLHRLGLFAKPDLQTADRDADALLANTQPLPEQVERYAHQCRERQE